MQFAGGLNLGIIDLCSSAPLDNNPIRVLTEFLEKQKKIKELSDFESWRFVGYVLELNYTNATIITSDTYKKEVGGIPRNSLLIMVPAEFNSLPPHFTLLRVLQSAPTPLSKEVQQTYFELQKRSMPELDVFTQSELMWSALNTSVIGMFYINPDDPDKVEFSGDLNNFVSAHKYELYSPNDEVLDLIVNSMVPKENCFTIGKLRLTECRLPLPKKRLPNVDVLVSTKDFMGKRTAMFGKTRLGKSNVVKLIAESLIVTTKETKNVGQIIFDINGEYANDNDWDSSLASVYPDYCVVYSLTPKEKTRSKPLKLDFYESPNSSHKIIASLLKESGKNISNYISSFLSVDVPSIEILNELPKNLRLRATRKILIYWAILYKAGFAEHLEKLKELIEIDPKFSQELRETLYNNAGKKMPSGISSFEELIEELKVFSTSDRKEKLKSTSKQNGQNGQNGEKKDLFDADDVALLNFLFPTSTVSAGPKILQYLRKYHDPRAGNFKEEILGYIGQGKTVVLDLGNAAPEVMIYFSEYLSNAVFNRQVEIFSNKQLGKNYVQLYFEEAHNLFPATENKSDIYSKIAKEGAKYHIGMVYSTQSPSTISKDLLAQTENFFIAHMSSKKEVRTLSEINVAYEDIQEDILQAKTPGFIRMLTLSHRFVISVQALKFNHSSSEHHS